MDHADYALPEGRERIREIRDDNDTFRELSELLSECGEEMAELRPQSFAISLAGESYQIDVRTRDEIYQIGHEAICNALKDSGGSTVQVHISYATNPFSMRISVDGVGMEPDLFESGRACIQQKWNSKFIIARVKRT